MDTIAYVCFRSIHLYLHNYTQMKVILALSLFFTTASLHAQTEKYESLTPEINKIIKKTKAVGVSIAIIENYKVVWAKGFGVKEAGTRDSVTAATLFQAASMSKPVTAVAVMKKVQEGKISLTEDINKQLSSWQLPDNEYTKQSKVNVKELLSHTGGISGAVFKHYNRNDTLPTIVQALNGQAPAINEPVRVTWYPGKYVYSAGGYSILEMLLMDTEKKTYPAIMEQTVLAPLQMEHSTFDYHLPGREFASGHLKKNAVMDGKYMVIYPFSFGGLWSTPADLARFLAEVQLSLKGEPDHILDQQHTRLMLTPVANNSGSQYALGFTIAKRGPVNFFGHDGHNYGYISSMLASLEGGYGMVIMTNSENGWKAVNKIKKLVGRKYWGLGPYHP